MRARTSRRTKARAQSKKSATTVMLRHSGRRWTVLALAMAVLFVVVGATAAVRARSPLEAIFMPAATGAPSSSSVATSEEWPEWVHGKDEIDIDFDLSGGRGEHKEGLILPRRQPVSILSNGEGSGRVTTKVVGDLKPGDRVRMKGGHIGLVLKAEPSPDREPPPRGQSVVIGKSERLTDTLLVVQTTGDILQTTPEHPFMVKGKGWTEAGKLVRGDVLDASHGAHIEVLSTEQRKVSPPVRVYNLETWPDHTYLVGKERLRVHNGGCITPPAGVLPAGVRLATTAEQGAARTLAQDIAAGHGFEKHVLRRGEFPLVGDRATYASGAERVIASPETLVRDLSSGRTGFFHPPSGTLVITKPGYEGTMFRPELGLKYFLEVLE